MPSESRAFVTGGTGLIGRAVVERLLERGVATTMMLRGGAEERRASELQALREVARSTGGALTTVVGDLCEPGMGLDKAGKAALRAATDCFHIAALYDIEASEEALLRHNVEGTAHLLRALKECGFSGSLHHVSSTAVAGDFGDTFTESMLQEGQQFPHPYHRSKLESEVLVRQSGIKHRVYRPSSVVGDSKTGAIDRIDGIYFGFGGIRQLAYVLPRWMRVPVPRIRGAFNLVPVDYVADALVHIAFSDTKQEVFHLVDPKPLSITRMTAELVRAAGGPKIGPAINVPRLPGLQQAGSLVKLLPSVRELYDAYLTKMGVPADGAGVMNLKVRFDDSNTQGALQGSGISCPPLRSYAKTLYRYYEDHLDPHTHRAARYRRELSGKVILITGASRGIGEAAARIAAEAGATVLVVARSEDALRDVVKSIRSEGGKAHAYPTDLSSLDAVDALAESVLAEHGGVNVLVHNAARSIRRPVAASLDRFHDYERTMGLNYFSPVRLTLRLLPSLRERGGSISHVLTMGVLIPGPYFAAYLASKSALDAFGDALAAEHAHEGVHVSSVYLPLVKTEMAAPTKEYEGRFDVWTPERAAKLILDGIVDKRRRVGSSEYALYTIANRFNPWMTTRILNVLQRAFPIGEDAKSEFPMERAFIEKTIGGSPL